ncbi:helix-turn-helix transcriptional regulator [Spongiibacter sp. KMU-166]|uniref:Helix-turn-helix transcriptional regulator n=1 Tax=Spongiibacter thalassae TaxID=2721624 RepID=A0ABX1GCC7_9GAMM|nr:helix-turn-helix transcriptional regulator [Spongiibacter thalassae]NKI16253.1 helix-turn-helix transcriptional regulator [Spongiibacter thalassae]
MEVELGWNPSDHLTDSGRFPLRFFEFLLEAASVLLQDEKASVKSGMYVGENDIGFADYLLKSAPGSTKAISAIVECSPVLLDFGALGVELSKKSTTLLWELPPKTNVSLKFIEFHLSVLCKILDAVLLEDCFCKVGLRSGIPVDNIKSVLGVDVVNTKSNCLSYIEIDSAYFDECKFKPEEFVHDAMLQRLRREMAIMRRDSRFASTVYEQINVELINGNCNVEKVAECLSVSSRTLQRRLSECGTSFSEILDDVRRNLAGELIVDARKSYMEMTLILGFSNKSSFHKAFNRWFNVAPGVYRECLVNN